MAKVKLCDQVCNSLIKYVTSGDDILIPNYFFDRYEMDLFRITNNDMIVEYEIKTTRADYRADFKKTYTMGPKSYSPGAKWKTVNKHEAMISAECRTNRFFFVVPDGMVKPDEVPKYAGLIYYKGHNHFQVIKAAPLIHKRKATEGDPGVYKMLAKLLTVRALAYRQKLQKLNYLGTVKKWIDQ